MAFWVWSVQCGVSYFSVWTPTRAGGVQILVFSRDYFHLSKYLLVENQAAIQWQKAQLLAVTKSTGKRDYLRVSAPGLERLPWKAAALAIGESVELHGGVVQEGQVSVTPNHPMGNDTLHQPWRLLPNALIPAAKDSNHGRASTAVGSGFQDMWPCIRSLAESLRSPASPNPVFLTSLSFTMAQCWNTSTDVVSSSSL